MDEDSINWWQNYIETKLGQTMSKKPGTTGSTPYYDLYLQAARDATRDAKERSGTDRARIVGVLSYVWDPNSLVISAVKANNLFINAKARPANETELPDSSGWSILYKNEDGASEGTWRNWLYEYGKEKAGGEGTYLTIVVWAVAENESRP